MTWGETYIMGVSVLAVRVAVIRIRNRRWVGVTSWWWFTSHLTMRDFRRLVTIIAAASRVSGRWGWTLPLILSRSTNVGKSFYLQIFGRCQQAFQIWLAHLKKYYVSLKDSPLSYRRTFLIKSHTFTSPLYMNSTMDLMSSNFNPFMIMTGWGVDPWRSNISCIAKWAKSLTPLNHTFCKGQNKSVHTWK